jgi:hypothetical protein
MLSGSNKSNFQYSTCSMNVRLASKLLNEPTLSLLGKHLLSDKGRERDKKKGGVKRVNLHEDTEQIQIHWPR